MNKDTDGIIDELLALESWDSIGNQNLDDDKKKRKKAQLEDAQLFLHTFDTDAGRLVLTKMLEMFLSKSIAKPNDDMVSIGIREGQARVVRWILQQIAIAKKG